MEDIILSFVLGIIVAVCLFYWYHKSYVFKGPNSKDVKSTIFRHNDKCYVLQPKVYLCPK